MNQKAQVLQWMRRKKTITQTEAAKYFGCWRLSARIEELRRDGYDIATVLEPNSRRGVHAVYQLRMQ